MRPLITIMIMLAATALVGIEANAAPVEADAALNLAQGFMATQSGGRLMANGSTLRLAHAEPSSQNAGEVDYYVFNTSDDGAYVIVAGEDRVKPILGYGNGSLDVEHLPCNLRWWLDGYKRQIEWLREHPELQAVDGPRRSPAEGQTIEPMVTCHWSQEEPYDWECAVYGGEYCLTGCVATALAQVMYYWKFPDVLPELPGYTSETLQIVHEPLPSVSVDWDNMLDDYYTNHYTDQQGHAVARLMRYCSQACKSDCSPRGTASSHIDQVFSLNMFGYSRRIDFAARDNYSNDEWRAMLDGELLSGRPVLYDGNDSSGGHAFVIDGYDNGLYHVNWGWGGYYDGFFELDLLDPYPGCAFMYGHDMVYQIYPADGNESVAPTNYDFEEDGIYYRLQGNEAVVTNRDADYNTYSGHVEVPRTVTHDGVTYRVTRIGDKAFAMCEDLESVSLPYIESIGHYSFIQCTNLREVTLGKSFKHGGLFSFYGSDGIDRVNIDDIKAWAEVYFETLPANPMSLAQHVYCNGEELTHLVIGGLAQSVKQFTFSCVKSLKSVTLEDGVKTIGDYAFYECPNLERVTLPDGLRHVGYSAFYYCSRLQDLQMKGSVGKIDEYAFYFCPIQGTLTFPAHVDTICYASFCYGNIDRLILHDVDRIVDYAFFFNPNLEQVSIQGMVKSIGYGAFEECPAIKRVDVKDLPSWCRIEFENSTANPVSFSHQLHVDGKALTRLEVPAGVDAIHDYAFIYCDSLTSVTVEGASIGKSAFYQCANIEEVTLGDNVASVGQQAFYGCPKIEKLTLGRGLKTLSARAFAQDNNIRDITCRALVPPVIEEKNCFPSNVYRKATLTVPVISLQAYKNAENWKQFVNMDSATLGVGDVNGDGEVNIVDVNLVIASILKDENLPSRDVNWDHQVNISDVNTIIKVILMSD